MKKLLLLCFAVMGLALQSQAQTWTEWNKHYFPNGQLAFYTRAAVIDLGKWSVQASDSVRQECELPE
jgi:hypothetical protein